MDQKELREWLRAGLAKTDKKRTATELAKILGVERTAISKILSGNRQVKAHEVRKIAEYIEEAPPFGDYSTPIPSIAKPTPLDKIAKYCGDIAARVWKDMSIQGVVLEEKVRHFPTERYADLNQGYLRITDDSCNLFAKKGELVWVVLYDTVRTDPQNLDYVIVERSQHIVTSEGRKSLSEWTIRRVIKTGSLIILKGLSTIPGLTPDLEYDPDSQEMRISHLVIGRGQMMDY